MEPGKEMALVNCPECGNEVSEHADECPECGYPVEPKADGSGEPDRDPGKSGESGSETLYREEDETEILRLNPKMFRQAPFTFLLYLLLPAAALAFLGVHLFSPDLLPEFLSDLPFYVPLIVVVIAAIPLFIWWLRTKSETLIVTDKKTRLRTGILSKDFNEVYHAHVRNVQVDKNFFQRVLGVGDVKISSAGQSGVEIKISGIRRPERLNEIIDDHM